MASSLQYGDTCGEGTPYGCGRGIPDGERAHIVVNGRKPIRAGESPHVLFHLDCCVCSTHPERVEPWKAKVNA